MNNQSLRAQFLFPPRELGFGTSGLRGRVVEITDLEAYINTRGLIAYLLSRAPTDGGIRPGSRIAVAGDLRPSTHSESRSILRAVTGAILDSGCQVEYCGRIPTPALMFHGVVNGTASIMVTGSHIPFDRNGIKFNRSDGEILKEDEAGILAAVKAMREEEYGRRAIDSKFSTDGFFKPNSVPIVPALSADAEDEYLRRYREASAPDLLSGLRLLFYQHSSVGGELVPRILRALGADVVVAGKSAEFIPIDTEDIGEETLHIIERLVDDAGGFFDAAVSTDGDSDRPLVCGLTFAAGAAKATFFPGDLLGLVTAEFLRADAVIVPVSANDAVGIHLSERNVPVTRTRIGSPYVIKEMMLLRKKSPETTRIMAWESNGGFMTGTRTEIDGRPLAPLPTRDAVLPIIAALAAAKQAGVGLIELFSRLPRRFGKSGLVDNVSSAAASSILAALSTQDSTFERLTEILRSELGFDRVTSVNTIDGLRIRSAAGDVIHLRPSGNAPQFRVYTCADSPDRAAEIVAASIREPDGLIRKLEARFGL